MKKRHFLQTSGLALGLVLIGKLMMAAGSHNPGDLIGLPDKITASVSVNEITLLKSGTGKWQVRNISVWLENQNSVMEVLVEAPRTGLSQTTLVWETGSKLSSTVLNDHWERTYGDVSRHKSNTTEIFPWYFMEVTAKNEINGFGVKTGSSSFGSCQVTENGLSLLLDTLSGGDGVKLSNRILKAAEIVLQLDKTIREAARETYIIDCNTISHRSAGLFELNRVGDDTSSHEWERTCKMGVTKLAFLSVHQGTFYAAEGDCVGLTPKVSWNKNKQWMELLAKSGTPLFISAQPEATGAEQKAFIKEYFALASQDLPVGEPLEWMENAIPSKCKLIGETIGFNWEYVN